MAEYTNHYNLIKPDPAEYADIQELNKNFDKIDEELHENAVAKYFSILGDGGENHNPPMQTLILYNPGPAEKRVSLETGDGRRIVTIPPLSTSTVMTQNGAFSLVNHGGIETHCSPSITYNRTDVNVAHYEIDTCGVMRLEYEFSM